MLDVRRMRVLREVAARGSFSAAADALAYTQSAVSQQIAALEREAGTVLVDRSARGVRLTDAGRALVDHADVILARLADAEAELEAIAGLRGGRLRLAAFPSAGATIMPEAIARFRERYPAVELSLEPAEPEPALAMLRAGEVDIGLDISAGFRTAREDGLERVALLDDPMYVALPARHPLARKRTLKLSELADESWILGTTGSCPDASIFLRSCQLAGFEPRIAFNSDDYFAIQGFVAAGVGASFIPDLALVNVRDDIVVRSLGARPPVRRVTAAVLEGSFCSPARRAMLDVLVEVGGEFAGRRSELALAS
ncbi:MAG TPA: LysR family transcriptional regulator [Solirubrobacteraceae bacterium]|nr:LysR family transcriptional regulator [Solirubrobacteraceae bacterium]